MRKETLMRKSFGVILILDLTLIFLSFTSNCAAQEVILRIYAAAGLTKPMSEVIKKFEAEHYITVQPNFGPSGGLYAQIKQGQPCDLFYAADWIYIEKLYKEGVLVEVHRFLEDKVALIVSKTGETKVRNFQDLTKKGVTLAVADRGAPVGVYAERGLKKLGTWEAIVAGGNLKARPSTVNAVALIVKEDHVDAGMVYSSMAKQFKIRIVEVLSHELTGEIVFGVGITTKGNREWSRKFHEFAKSHINEFVKWGWIPCE